MIPSFDEYAAHLKAQGFDEVLVRNWSPVVSSWTPKSRTQSATATRVQHIGWAAAPLARRLERD
jgi:hypothetical protein